MLSAAARRRFVDRLYRYHYRRRREECASALGLHRPLEASLRAALADRAADLLRASSGCTPCCVAKTEGRGRGLFAARDIEPGEVLAFYPGTLLRAALARRVEDHDWLFWREDGCLIDPLVPEAAAGTSGPLAVGHLCNHPPAGAQPNALFFDLGPEDWPDDAPGPPPNWSTKDLQTFEPHLATTVLVGGSNAIPEGAEVLVDYNLEMGDATDADLPSWYAAVAKPGRPRPSDWVNWVPRWMDWRSP